MSQRGYADGLGVPLKTYQTYEQGKREPDLRTLSALHERGWSLAWLLFGEGEARPAAQDGGSQERRDSQPVRQEALKIAVTLAQQALDGRTLPPAEYGELVMLIYEALVNGLPSAQVLAFARPAARGLQGEAKDESGPSMGGAGGETARGR